MKVDSEKPDIFFFAVFLAHLPTERHVLKEGVNRISTYLDMLNNYPPFFDFNLYQKSEGG